MFYSSPGKIFGLLVNLPAKRRLQTCRQKGFTLIEILAVLFIFVFISFMLFSGMTQVQKSRDINKENAIKLELLQDAFTLLQFDFLQAVSDSELDVKNTPQGSFYTEGKNLHFDRLGFINPDYAYSRSTIEKISYLLIGDKLIRRSGTKGRLDQQDYILFSHVKSVRWIFYGEQRETHEIWPPVQDLRFKIPLVARLIIDIDKIGMIEKIFELPGLTYGIAKKV